MSLMLNWRSDFEIKESPDWCGIAQNYGDQFDWTISHGSTPSDPTGPYHAFTGRWFAYIEASEPRKPNDTAKWVQESCFEL